MRLTNDRLVLSPTDLADFLACRHKTTLELEAVHGDRVRPHYTDPLADILRQRGMEHEARHVESLRVRGLSVTDLKGERDVQRTVEAMRSGVDVIVQAPLGRSGQGTEDWFGFADVLVKVPGASDLGDWHYEAHDTKLARETRAGAILQLCVYTELLGDLQGRTPEYFRVVTPKHVVPAGSERANDDALKPSASYGVYRFSDVAAYYRLVKAQLLQYVGHAGVQRAINDALKPSASYGSGGVTYPDPVDHCSVCRWWQVCDKQRRDDDHLQFVANLGRSHKRELETQHITTLAKLAEWDVPKSFRPTHGSRETFEKLQDQAALQKKQRETNQPEYKRLDAEPGRGLSRLPEPSPGDLYLDLEGDPFARNALGAEAGEGSREYLFGLGSLNDAGEFQFRSWWAFTDGDEQRAFEDVMDEIARVIEQRPSAHVYHYAPYEPSAFKRLAGRYNTKGDALDVLLRGGRFLDLYAVVRESVRAGVETYSIKSMEPFYNFTRDIDLRKAGQERRAIEIALESGDLGAISQDIRDAVEGYNRDDVRSTRELQKWLESLRSADTPRPVPESGEASETVGEREQRVEALRARLLSERPRGSERPGALERPGFSPAVSVGLKPDGSAHFLAAHLLDWHRRENKAEWWEYFRLVELDDESLLDERKAVSGLEYLERVDIVVNKKTGKPTGSVIDRYRFPQQDCDIKDGDKLNLTDKKSWGEVVAFDRVARTMDVKVGPGRADARPAAAFAHEVVTAPKIEDALYEIGTAIADGTPSPLAMALLNADPPPTRDVLQLHNAVLAIQGPPGTGKTYSGGVMICDLVAAGKSVGVTALSHAAIANLLKAVRKEATKRGVTVPILHVKNEDEFGDDNPRVIGGTAWHWCHPDTSPVDVLFVDEAGQMSLANTLACTVATSALVLLGDPQQLEQPTKGVHPDGVGGSALQHILGAHKTMPSERGEFLGVTRRLAPSICAFTSECFYEDRLTPLPGLERQVLRGASRFHGSGLRVVPVEHDGNRNASDEEVAEIVRIVEDLLASGSEWVDEHGVARQVTASDILIVAPYNAQVSRIQETVRRAGWFVAGQIGTVDKFQGQEAPVVIYSMATSRPEDAPRGLGFLYSLNRFNVATSRARCLCILVANPRLFEPDCQTPAQMQLANAMCRYRELSEA